MAVDGDARSWGPRTTVAGATIVAFLLQVIVLIVNIGLNAEGERYRPLERMEDHLHGLEPAQQFLFEPARRTALVRTAIPEMIRRELAHAGVLAEDASFSARLLAWVEIT